MAFRIAFEEVEDIDIRFRIFSDEESQSWLRNGADKILSDVALKMTSHHIKKHWTLPAMQTRKLPWDIRQAQ